MSDYQISRQDLLETVKAALEPQEFVLAMWEGGAAGFDRVDQWSDVDVHVIVKDGHVEQAFEVAEAALAEMSETKIRYRVPEPTWHGHSQCYYCFEDASPFLMLDLVFMEENSQAERYLQAKTHGRPLVWFDKAGLVVEEPLDIEAMMERMRADLEMDRLRMDLFWTLTAKEINRGNGIEALNFYSRFVLQPLVRVLRITYCPQRHFYTSRYPRYDLPEEAARRLERLYFVSDLDELKVKFEEARDWFYQTADAVDWKVVRERLETA